MAIDEKRGGGANIRYTLFSLAKTTVNADSAAAQKKLYVTDPTVFAAGDYLLVDPAGVGGGTEYITVDTVEADHVVSTTNLAYTHTALQADIVMRQGVSMDEDEGGSAGDGTGEVYRLKDAVVTIKAASVTDGNGFTVSLYSLVNDEWTLIHTDSIVLAADNGTYKVTIGFHMDDIKCLITNYKDGTPTIKMSGRL